MFKEYLQIYLFYPKNLLWGDRECKDESLNHIKEIEVKVVNEGVRTRITLNKFVIFFYFVYGVVSCS